MRIGSSLALLIVVACSSPQDSPPPPPGTPEVPPADETAPPPFASPPPGPDAAAAPVPSPPDAAPAPPPVPTGGKLRYFSDCSLTHPIARDPCQGTPAGTRGLRRAGEGSGPAITLSSTSAVLRPLNSRSPESIS